MVFLEGERSTTMLRIDVLYKPGKVSDEDIGHLSQALPTIVASAFTEAARLGTEEEAEVGVSDVGVYPDPIGPMAIQHYDVVIYISAPDFESWRNRELNIETAINHEARILLTEGVTAFVRITLSKDMFTEFRGTNPRST